MSDNQTQPVEENAPEQASGAPIESSENKPAKKKRTSQKKSDSPVISKPRKQNSYPSAYPDESLTAGLRTQPIAERGARKWLWFTVGTSTIVITVLLGLYIKSLKDIAEISRKVEQQQSDPTARVREENKTLLEKVGQLIVLPSDEQPTIATVEDTTKLQDQPFFAKAQIGDKVIIYNKAKKAILYRPEENKIIELAPLNIGNEPSTQQ